MNKEMTVKEAGRKGGLMTKKRHQDDEFFKEIGRKGGQANARKISEEGISDDTRNMLSVAGKKGGERTKELHGKEFYIKIGRKGGKKRRKI